MKETGKQRGFEIVAKDESVFLHVTGKTLEDLFRNATRGVASYLKEGVLEGSVENADTIEMEIEAVDINSLLIETLSRVIAESDIRGSILVDASFKTFGENFLTADFRAVPADGFDHEIAAVSYQDVDIKKNSSTGNFEATLMLSV